MLRVPGADPIAPLLPELDRLVHVNVAGDGSDGRRTAKLQLSLDHPGSSLITLRRYPVGTRRRLLAKASA